MSIPIDPSGMQQHLAMVQREFAALAAAKKEMIEKPKPSASAAQTFGKLDPQATQGTPPKATPAEASATRFMLPTASELHPDRCISQQDGEATTADHLQRPAQEPDAEGVLDQVSDLAGKGAHALDRIFDFGVKATDVVGRNGFEFLRDKAGEGLRAVTSDDPVGNLIDMVPLKNAAKAAIQELPPFSRDKITLDDDAIKLIKQDPAFIDHEGKVVAAIEKDPRYGHESFSVPLSELPVDPYVEFGGKRGAGDMKQQLLHAWDITDPNIRETWKVAGNDLTWLLRHAKVDGTAHVDQGGNVKIDYQVTDKLDLRPNGSSGAYDKVTEIMGTIWHDKLHAKESKISGTFSTETRAS